MIPSVDPKLQDRAELGTDDLGALGGGCQGHCQGWGGDLSHGLLHPSKEGIGIWASGSLEAHEAVVWILNPGGLRSATQLCLEAGGVSRTGLETSGSAPSLGPPSIPPSGASRSPGSGP